MNHVSGPFKITQLCRVPVASEEDEVVLDEVHQDLPDQLAHVHPAYHLVCE